MKHLRHYTKVPSPPNVRAVAARAIRRTASGIHIQQALSETLAGIPLSQKDINLCADLVYGYFRTFRRVHHILHKVLPAPERLPDAMLVYLSLAVYGMRIQEKVPDYAAVGETVKLIKKEFGQNLAKVANGALRSIQRLGTAPDELEWYFAGKRKDEQATRQAQGIFYSMPQVVVDIWHESYGDDILANLLRRNFARPWTAVRINRRHAKFSGLISAFASMQDSNTARIGATGFAFAPGQLPENVLGQSLAAWHKMGAISYQGASSMLVLEKLGLHDWTVPVWDGCAGFGGKSLYLMENSVPVSLATDLSFKRLKNFPRECTRLNLPFPKIMAANLCRLPITSWNGNILIDAPCSGLGVLGRRPDLRVAVTRKNWSPVKFAATQSDILKNTVSLLQPGREMVYITCTLNPLENEKNIEKIIRSFPALKLVESWCTPHSHPWLEGMFGARLKLH